ncbi:MAG TPA: glycosyltransferase family 4 protein [Vicinamibacterales bacterium]
MRIAQVAPLYERVPPVAYGGTERVVSHLTEELVRRGHEVTLFASGDSVTSARLVPLGRSALRLDPECRDPLARHVAQLEAVARLAHAFEVVHFHTGFLHFPLARRLNVPNVSTLHGRLDLPDLRPLFAACDDVPVVSISRDQRRPLPGAHWVATVHHGLPPDHVAFSPRHDGYLAFVGRIAPEKRPDRAIEIARRAGLPLRIAAKVDAVDREYYESRIRPLLQQDGIEYLGELPEPEKLQLLAGAMALLFPIDWPEPFGMVVIEALGCGTPVIAWRCGSVPELVEHGRTGFIVESLDDAVAAVGEAEYLDRAVCRQVFERRFTAARMARDYELVYRRVIDLAARRAPEEATA